MGTRPNQILDEDAFGSRLRRIRKEKGLTQAELAAKLGLQQSMIAQYEGGYIRLRAASLITRMAQALDVSPNALLGVETVTAATPTKNRSILRRLKQLDHLPIADQKALVRFLDALLARHETTRRSSIPVKTSRMTRVARNSRRE